jgi:prepilin-type N-terminal cleavage/methylation domain-containing protein
MLFSRKHKQRSGFSLVEVMIATVILSFMAMTTIAAAMYSRLLSENIIYQNMALTATLGYAEQMRNMNYAELLASYRDPDNVPLPAVSASAVMIGSFTDLDDPIYVGNNVNNKQILIDIENLGLSNERQVLMNYDLTIEMADLNTGLKPIQAFEIKLNYSWETPRAGGRTTRSGSIKFVKAKSK